MCYNKLSRYNSFKDIWQLLIWVSQSSYYSVMEWTTGVQLHHVTASPKVGEQSICNNCPISNTHEDIGQLLIWVFGWK